MALRYRPPISLSNPLTERDPRAILDIGERDRRARSISYIALRSRSHTSLSDLVLINRSPISLSIGERCRISISESGELYQRARLLSRDRTQTSLSDISPISLSIGKRCRISISESGELYQRARSLSDIALRYRDPISLC
jgi:hypothetical protein